MHTKRTNKKVQNQKLKTNGIKKMVRKKRCEKSSKKVLKKVQKKDQETQVQKTEVPKTKFKQDPCTPNATSILPAVPFSSPVPPSPLPPWKCGQLPTDGNKS